MSHISRPPFPSRQSSPLTPGPVSKLPFFYGWIVVGVAFVTMGIGVNARSAFSLLFPPILDEFGWTRGDTAAVFAVGFLASSIMSPFIGMAIDRFGPRLVFPFGGLLVTAGLLLGTFSNQLWHFFMSIGVLVIGGSVIFAYVGHSTFLPNWFVRNRGLAIALAFSGVGVFAIFMMPWLQVVIDSGGWRQACWILAALVFVIVIPLNLLAQRQRPQDMGLQPDGVLAEEQGGAPALDNIVDRDWAETDWTLKRALATTRFWWLAGAFFCSLYTFYAVQVHQTKFLTEIGFSSEQAAFALGLTLFLAVFGMTGLGWLSDRIGREWVWSIACLGFMGCYGVLLLLAEHPSLPMLYAMVVCQGLIGAGMSPMYAAIPAELFQGRQFGAIMGTLSLFATLGGASGPWLTGLLFDRFGSYDYAFWLAMSLSAVSILCVWRAAPRKVRLVTGRIRK